MVSYLQGTFCKVWREFRQRKRDKQIWDVSVPWGHACDALERSDWDHLQREHPFRAGSEVDPLSPCHDTEPEQR